MPTINIGYLESSVREDLRHHTPAIVAAVLEMQELASVLDLKYLLIQETRIPDKRTSQRIPIPTVPVLTLQFASSKEVLNRIQRLTSLCNGDPIAQVLSLQPVPVH